MNSGVGCLKIFILKGKIPRVAYSGGVDNWRGEDEERNFFGY